MRHIADMEDRKMAEVKIQTSAATLTMQLFPLPPAAVRALRAQKDAPAGTPEDPDKDDQTATHTRTVRCR